MSKTKNKHMVIPVFIPHKGCPFDCIFCNQKLISGQIKDVTEADMRETIESHISSAKENTYIEIAFYGGSFTGIDRGLQFSYLKIADEYIKRGVVKGIRLSTRPDYINKSILEYLVKFNVKTIELGVQSLDEDVLIKACRGHDISDVMTSSRLINEYGINLGIQTMIGLPGDTSEKALFTAQRVVELKPQIARIYPTLVIKNTYLEKLYNEGKYNPVALEDAIELCADLLEIYSSNEINVIRIGLQTTENINEGKDVIAGPFHPAFRQLVESRLALRKVIKQIRDKNIMNEDEITIYCETGNISDVIGQKKYNIHYLKTHFPYKNIKIIEKKGIKEKIIVEKFNNIQV